jgi:hypothetical protein
MIQVTIPFLLISIRGSFAFLSERGYDAESPFLSQRVPGNVLRIMPARRKLSQVSSPLISPLTCADARESFDVFMTSYPRNGTQNPEST